MHPGTRPPRLQQFPPSSRDKTTDSDKITARLRSALPTRGKPSKQDPAPRINEKVSISITSWSMEQTLVIHANYGNYHQYQKLPDTSICSTWKILCGQGDTCVKDFVSLPSISTLCSSVRAADPTRRPNFPKSQASDHTGKLEHACKAVLQYLGSEIRHAQDTRDRLSHSQQALSNSGQTSWTHTTPVAKPLHTLQTQPSLRAAVLPQVFSRPGPHRHHRHKTLNTEHMRLTAQRIPLAGKCGNRVLGPDMLCPRAHRLAGV